MMHYIMIYMMQAKIYITTQDAIYHETSQFDCHDVLALTARPLALWPFGPLARQATIKLPVDL